MRLSFFGHAAFYIESLKGTRLITDPYEPEYKGMIHYRPICNEADVVTISHDHGDHNYVEGLPGNPQVVRGVGSWRIDDLELHGIASFHDSDGGTVRGVNTIFVLNVDGIRICHLGDLGHLLSKEQERQIAPVDILLLPVGGNFTIGPLEALTVAERINARCLIPMHYKTDKIDFELRPLEDFLKLVEKIPTETRKDLVFNNIGSVPRATRIYILEPKC